MLRSAVLTPVSITQQSALGVTLDCRRHCQTLGGECPAFSVNYYGVRCAALDRNSNGKIRDLVPRDGENYFEKICMKGPAATRCQTKAWAFERAFGYQLAEEFYEKTVGSVETRQACEQLCLEETDFTCRSASYEEDSTSCRLSREDRRSQPQRFVRTGNPRLNYLENQCVQARTDCAFVQSPNAYPTYTDVVETSGITSQASCEDFCTNYGVFNCRAFAYYSSNSQCFLSGDDKISAGGMAALQSRPGLAYFERTCEAPPPPDQLASTPPPPSPLESSLTTAAARPYFRPQVPHLNEQVLCKLACMAALRCNPTEKMAFAKVPGYDLTGVTPEVLYQGDLRTPAVTEDCFRRCDPAFSCHAFVLDYERRTCTRPRAQAANHLPEIRPTLGRTYFEAICVPCCGRAAFLQCPLLWVLERHLDLELSGVSARDVLQFVTLADCERRCLEERRFSCRAANYHFPQRECRLHSEDRSAPVARLAPARGVIYIENQCTVDASLCGYQRAELGFQMIYVDRVAPGTVTSTQCEQACSLEQAFRCRSYTFLPGGGCLLSGDNRDTTPTLALTRRPGAFYVERACQFSGGVTPPLAPPTTAKPPVVTLPPAAGCTFEQYTYEKVVGMDFHGARRTSFRTSAPVGVLSECQAECQRLGPLCSAFSIHYGAPLHSCFLLDLAARETRPALVASPGSAYFEKVCLRESHCGRLYAFERVPGYELRETPIREVPDVPLRNLCEDLCLRDPGPCKSANFFPLRRLCRLYYENRRTRPLNYQPASEEVDYLENLCIPAPPTCEYTPRDDHFFPYVDRVVGAFSAEECRRMCDAERTFACRSANFEPVTRECGLSGADTGSVPEGSSALQYRRATQYSEQGSCEQGRSPTSVLSTVRVILYYAPYIQSMASKQYSVSPVWPVTVQCNQQDMVLTLKFAGPFKGRIYAKGNPIQCFLVGNGQTSMQFPISLGPRCGTKHEVGAPRNQTNHVLIPGEQPGERFSNEVVIQQHPVIVTESDRTIRVACSFQTNERMYTMGSSFLSQGMEVTTRFQLPIHSVVTNTAPPPNVLMKVVDRGGREARSVGLGDELTLRIEMLEPSELSDSSRESLPGHGQVCGRYLRALRPEPLRQERQRGVALPHR
ncbi:hypothetical protein LAZ67_2000066 [Cordylochernes scorpioides]|uniref:PAN domain-containing protein n=1 Tax=Cordylochernes scorpioides TaxID=51811 RepID=A0ABY6K1I6_9ARAC|nr:hypothetical protein LAZ67_2000066 [Cordylochernes scorpioides]